MTSIPSHCLASGALAVGATIAATQLHNNSRVPKSCIASAIAGSATVATVIAHHGSGSSPAWYCVAGGAVGVVGVGYALSAHAELAKIPTECKLYTACALALIVAGAAALGKK